MHSLLLLLMLRPAQGAVSVKDFGAIADSVTDDTAAIQRGLDAACGERFAILATSGAGVSPIVITTAKPHAFMNGSVVTIAGVAGNTNANGRWSATVLTPNAVALYSEAGEASVGNGGYTSGGTIRAPAASRLYFPAGTYNISSPLITGCAISLSGDGPTASIIFQTQQHTLNHGIVANYPLSMRDMAVNTTPLTVDYGMIAVFGGTSIAAAPMLGYAFTFVRVNSSGFNFGMDINGTSETDLLRSIMVDDCNISVGTQANAVSQPINAANARFLTVQNSTLTGDSIPGGVVNNDHGIYTLAIRGVLIENNLIENHGNSAIKLLQGGFHAPSCPTIQDYASWTIDNNRIAGSRMAIAVYSFCDLVMPSIVISNNTISNIADTYAGDYAAVYVQSNCQSNMAEVVSRGNVFTNLGLGGIVLASQVEADETCADPSAQGTISNFSSTGDTFINWSTGFAGTFPAINSTGLNLISASVSQLNAASNGGRALNLSAFAQVKVE
jgi:Right handed beta helix region